MPVRAPLRAALALTAAVGAALAWWWFSSEHALRIDHTNLEQVARGEAVYAKHCAACHGVKLEGQPNWQSRDARGRLPAPPHDVSGHTWHHDDQVLFEVTKFGMGRHAPPGYESDMPSFEPVLSDADIVAALAFIKSRWPADIHQRRGAAGMN